MSEEIYRKADSGKSYFSIAEEVLDSWKESGIKERIFRPREGIGNYVFLEGPPTANGRPHVGHAMTRTVKDTVLRYKYMRGYNILRRTAGWDCHGLPVELEAEKHFGFKTKKQIEDFGIDKFNEYCRESIFRYIDEWMTVDDLLGFWVDHENAYITLRNDYIESEWWALKTMFDKGLLVKDYKIVPYCPRCETSLSSHEVSQGYEEVKDPSLYVRFKEMGHENRYFLAWTTTPWTLPSNEFLSVNPDIEYSLIRHEGEELYLASEIVPKLFKGEYEILGKYMGKDLAGKEYEQLIPFLGKPSGTMKVVTGYHVTVTEGTGIVHTSPAFGADDFDIGKSENVEILNPVNLSGRFSDERLPWNGQFVKEADIEILKYLKSRGQIFKSEKIEHTYPFCYRCGSPLLYYPLEAWFIRVSTIRDKLIENNEKINWLPEHLKEGRFGNFLSEAKDWALSRNRYWGTPLPLWKCSNDHYLAVGSRNDIKENGGKMPQDLHRPFVDDVVLKCRECGNDMTREPYVIDTWFDSGSATYAAMHYPFEDRFSPNENFPIDFITEAIDQTRGWYYTLHVISSLLFHQNAYKNALTINFVLDEQGRKMSKSKGNSVFALDFVHEVGPDPMRLFFLTGAPWKVKSLDKKLINEVSSKTLGTLTNVYSFFASNANLDGYNYGGLEKSGNLLDRWIVSVVNSTIKSVREKMDALQLHSALRDIQELIDSISNFYLRLSRRRFWAESMNDEKRQAYSTLYYTIEATLRLLAPITPFTSEYLYSRLSKGKQSVHETPFPESESSAIDRELEESFAKAASIIESVRRVRQLTGIKGRQPVTEILVSGAGKLADELIELVKPEVNARDLRFVANDEKPVARKAELMISQAAPILRGNLGKVQKYLENADHKLLIKELESKGKLSLDGVEVDASLFKIEEQPEEGYGHTADPRTEIEVFVNSRMDEELVLEGYARELIRRIQVMRKDLNLEYDQKIRTRIDGNGPLTESLKRFRNWIMDETLSVEIEEKPHEDGREWDINGEKVYISIAAV